MKIKLCLLTLIIYDVLLASSIGSINWLCKRPENQCRRVIGPVEDNKLSMEACRLTCGEGNTLWPYPSSTFQISKELIPVDIDSREVKTEFNLHSPSESNTLKLISKMQDIIFDKLKEISKSYSDKDNAHSSNNKKKSIPLKIRANINSNVERLTYDTYEGYMIRKIENDTDVIIIADNYFGYRHAIVTLLQLIIYDPISQSYLMPSSFSIPDHPSYPHRGVMIDTGHNFMTEDSIKELLFGLSLSKINTVHWHISDSSSFPLMTWRNSKCAIYGAYSADKVYDSKTILSIMSYAKAVGIRLIPEIPIPAPMGSGWQWGNNDNLGDLIVCYNQPPYSSVCKNPPCGQLNIVNPNAVQMVKDLYKDLIGLFKDSIYHLGGANVDLSCWTGITMDEGRRLWSNLLNDIADMIIEKGGEVIVFSNDLLYDNEEWLSPDKFIIQVTENENSTWVQELITRGYRIILSPQNATRWDCGYGQYSPYAVSDDCNRALGWQAGYNLNLQNMVAGGQNILGAEGMLYSFFSGSHNTKERVLLKAAGIAERFWTNPVTNYLDAFPRIGYYSWFVKSFGLNIESVEPYWCTQNTGKCLIGQ